MTQIEDIGYFLDNFSTELVAEGGYTQNTEPDSILAVSPQNLQLCTGFNFGTVGGAA